MALYNLATGGARQKSQTPSPSPAWNSDQQGGGKKRKKKDEKHKKDKKHEQHKKPDKEKAGAPRTPAAVASASTGSARDEPEEAPAPKKETESQAEDDLEDFEKHLRQKALRSVGKAAVSPHS